MDGCLKIIVLTVCVVWTNSLSAVEPRELGLRPRRLVSMAYREPNGLLRPVVEVWSSGAVRAIELKGSRQAPVEIPHPDRLTAVELQELTQSLDQDWKLGELTTEQLARQLHIASQSRGMSADIPNAAQTEITLSRNGQEHVLVCPAVSVLSKRFPEVVEIQQVQLAQNRLLNIASVALVGGASRAEELVETANRQIQEMHPDESVTRRDLRVVRHLADGSRYVQFVVPAVAGQCEGFMVSLTQSPQGLARVSILENPTVIR